MFFYIDKESELTFSDVQYYISKFKTSEAARLERLDRYYKNDNDIMYRTFEDKSKPNNRISHSFADYIVKINVAMLVGAPISYNSKDDITEFENILAYADEQDVNVDLATNTAKYGYAIQLLYLDADAEIKMTALDNKQMVLIFSDDIEEQLLYAIRFWTVETVDFKQTEYIEVYSRSDIKRYRDNILITTDYNVFSSIPIVIYKNNTECRGDYENVITLIDEYDLLTSDTANENDYFNNAYLYLNTENVDANDIAQMKENRVIYGIDLNPSFILKQSNNTDLESEKERIIKDLHKLSFVPDLSDDSFANNVSGVAMKYKIFGTLNNMTNKQRKFKRGIVQRNRLLFDMMNIKSLSVPDKVDIIFTSNLPENSLETAQMINLLRGLVSDETLVSQLPFIQNAAEEVQIAKENRDIGDIYGGDFDE